MTPEQIKAIAAVASLLKMMGGYPFGAVLLMVVIGPWVGMIYTIGSMSRRNDRQNQRAERIMAEQNQKAKEMSHEFRDHVNTIMQAQEKRFEAVVRMYESNVKLVDDYNHLADDLTGIITLSTRTLEALVGKIDNNHFCPIVRKEAGK